jgi:hypothetical protein
MSIDPLAHITLLAIVYCGEAIFVHTLGRDAIVTIIHVLVKLA